MVVPTGYAQANLRYTGTGVPTGAEVTLGFEVSGFSGGPVLLGEEILTQYVAASLDQFHTSEVTLSSVLVKYGPDDLGPSGIAVDSVGGTASTPTVTPQVTALVRKVTAAGGRANRGRLYFPGIPEAQVSPGGILSDAWLNGLGPAWADFADGMALAGASSVLLHGLGSPVTTPTPLVGFACQPQCATQRRRNRR